MSDGQESPKKIIVDEVWKAQVQAEKEALEKAQKPSGESSETPPSDTAGDPPLPHASFDGLVVMLATQATMLLQEAADPTLEQRDTVLGHSKHLIDTLAILQEKTAGNLTPEEAMTLENVLHELRMGFVSVNQR